MKKIHLYFKKPPQGYKWVPGDRHMVHFIRKALRLKKLGGIEKVFINLCKGFDRLNVTYDVNIPFKKIKPGEPVVVLGLGKHCLQGYDRPNPIIAGIGLMTHPADWPHLFGQYPVAKYLQHSHWANQVYLPYYGKNNCTTWPAGIDTGYWKPDDSITKTNDVLIYNKIRWDKEKIDEVLRKPVIAMLDEMGLTHKEIIYGQYREKEYVKLLQQSRAMLFLCEHESQGLACCEALAMDIPVLAWDQGYCLDPNRFAWNAPVIPATSVPFFDTRCGDSFADAEGFNNRIGEFWENVEQGKYYPRSYILETLSLEKSAQRMLDIINEVYR